MNYMKTCMPQIACGYLVRSKQRPTNQLLCGFVFVLVVLEDLRPVDRYVPEREERVKDGTLLRAI